MTPASGIPWREWSTESFQAARRDGVPVLLLLTAAWSAACRHLEHGVLADPDVVRLVGERFVPLRADVDRRPDIADRYGLGGWPTLACLTSDGEVLSGGTHIDPARLARVLADLSEAFQARRDDLELRARQSRRQRRAAAGNTADESPAEAAAPWVGTHLRAAFDETWAGFGRGPKIPQAAPVAFALAHGTRTGERALVDLAVRTLDRLGWSDLSDAATGAFHRACRTREWGEPDTARLLDVQAELAALFLEASVALGEEAYADRARAAIGYVTATLGAADGGFYQSEGERGEDAGSVDRILVIPANARMARTLLRAAEVLHAPHLAEAAMTAVERIVPLAYAAGAGVAHYLTDGSPRVRGLLVDQVETSAALVDLSHASGNHVYRELAEELMRSCLRKLWHEGPGGFVDRLRTPSGGGDIGRMADPLVPYATNCEAARVLARLARETGDDALRVRACETLAALQPVYREQGVMSAEYALALAEVTADAQA